MPTSIELRLKMTNEDQFEWSPAVDTVDGMQFIKLDCKDRSCFRFFTGKSLTFGSKYENSKYLLEFWVYLLKARSEASQEAFEEMKKGLNRSDEGPQKARKTRFRRARLDDALTVGRIVKVNVEHDGNECEMSVLFGVKKSEPWVEATVSNMDFIITAMRSDWNFGNFASVRPRGPHFRLQNDEAGDASEDDDDEVHHVDDDSDAGEHE
jgi:hypothetical protein